MNEIIGLPAETGTALALIATGVIVPAVTSLLSYEGIPKQLKRFLPIILAALGAIVIVVLQGGGDLAENLTTWLIVLATVVGIAQALYSVMPGAWKKLERATQSATAPETPPRGHRGPPPPLTGNSDDPDSQSHRDS